MSKIIVLVINPGLQIAPQTLPTAAEDQPYDVTLRVLFGDAPIRILLVSGTLPDGLTFTDNGDGTATIAGTPTETGSFELLVEYQDVREDPRQQAYVLQVAEIPAPPVPVVVSGTAPAGQVGVPYTYTFTASGGDGGPYTWSIASGSLPPGITRSGATISGTPTTAATYNFTIRATDGEGEVGDSPPQIVLVAPIVYAAWNPLDKNARVVLSDANLVATHAASQPAGGWVRADTSKTSGKRRFQLKIINAGGGGGEYIGAGIATGASIGAYLGATATGWALWGGSGVVARIYSGGSATATGLVMSDGSYVDVLMDFGAGKGWIALNSTVVGGGNPVTGTSPTFTFTPGTALYPAADVNLNQASCRLRSDPSTFEGSSYSGFIDGWPA